MHCRECRWSEGEAADTGGGRYVLRLYCMAKGGRALEVCESFAATVHEVRDAYELTDQQADVLEGRR